MNRKTILLVEDNANDEYLTLRALKKYNVANDVVVARDGVEALDYLFATGPHAGRDTRDLPLVVLLDLKLPRVDGLEVLRRVRNEEQTRLLPVVILTSSNEERDVINGYKLGTNSYVQKPVDFTAFMDAVGQLGLYWLMLNQPVPTSK
ncbi:MAG TPA: response regulator [Candidatus Polarisedimenticolia bacterium]|nr:response regulator [Candidatus Polarisedimenticolia bacterium]